jgi:ABC-type lipoprotein release transport system permease subunit
MNEIVIIDPQTVRVLNSIQVATAAETETGEATASLFAFDIEDIFENAFAFDDEFGETVFSPEFLHAYLSETRLDDTDEEIGGDWNFIILRLENGKSAPAFISSLNNKLASYDVTAVNWRVAAGTSAILMLLIQSLFNAGVLLVSVAGVITAINILLIAVFRRTREIGTLRAIGASDSYIRSLIYTENIIISIASGIAGVCFGFLFMRWISSLGIIVTNNLVASLLGGSVLQIDIVPQTAVFSFFVALVLGIAASIYPVEAAVRIQPMAALRRG